MSNHFRSPYVLVVAVFLLLTNRSLPAQSKEEILPRVLLDLVREFKCSTAIECVYGLTRKDTQSDGHSYSATCAIRFAFDPMTDCYVWEELRQRDGESQALIPYDFCSWNGNRYLSYSV